MCNNMANERIPNVIQYRLPDKYDMGGYKAIAIVTYFETRTYVVYHLILG